MTRPTIAGVLRQVAVVFVVAWAVRSLIVTGGAVLNEPFGLVIATSPARSQATAGNGFEMSLVRIDQSISKKDHVVVVWVNPPNYDYVYFWSTFWLYPRQVTVLTTLDPSAPPDAETLIDIRLPDEAEPVLPSYSVIQVYSYSDHVITVYRRG